MPSRSSQKLRLEFPPYLSCCVIIERNMGERAGSLLVTSPDDDFVQTCSSPVDGLAMDDP